MSLSTEHVAEFRKWGVDLSAGADSGCFNSGGPTTTGKGGIEPGQEQVAPGEVRVDAELKQIDPATIIGLHGVDVKAMDALAAAIKKDGYLSDHPILTVDTPLGFLTLDGHHRGHAAQSLKLKSIPALVVKWTDFTNLLLLRFGNALPKKARSLDKYIYMPDGKPYGQRTLSNGHEKSKWGTPSNWAGTVSAEKFTCLCSLSVVESSVEFCGKQYTPDQAKAYIIATMVTSFPVYTKTRRAWMAAVIANSASSANDQVVDREHNLKFYAAMRGSTKDDVVGHIVDRDFPSKRKAVELAAGGEGVPLKVLICVSRKIEGVEQMLPDIVLGKFKLSQECEYDREESAFYDETDKKFYRYGDCSDEMKAILKRNTVDNWNGHPMLFCPGGEDGEVLFSGCALTRWPLDTTAQIESLAASEERNEMQLTKLFESLTCAEAWRGDDVPDELFAYVPAEARGKNGKKSLRDFALASASRKGLDPAIMRNSLTRFSQANLSASVKPGVKSKILSALKRWNAAHPSQKIEVSEKSGGQEFEVSGHMYAGCTLAAERYAGKNDGTAENHTHAIMSNGTVMPSGGHSHGLEILSIDLGEGVLCAVTTCAYDYLEQPAVPGDAVSSQRSGSSKMYEHRHIVRLTKESASNGETDVTGALRTAVSCQLRSGGGKDMQMTRQEVCAGLRTRAAAIKATDADAAAMLETHATELEKEASADSVETIIAGKVKEGALVTKEVHAQAVSAAKQAGKDELQKEISAKEEAAKAQADATKTRLASVVSAGLKPETVLGKDRTIQSVVSAIPAGPDGDKMFTDRLEEWSCMAKAVSASASGKKDSAASAGGPDPKMHMLGGKEAEPVAQPRPDTAQERSMAIL